MWEGVEGVGGGGVDGGVGRGEGEGEESTRGGERRGRGRGGMVEGGREEKRKRMKGNGEERGSEGCWKKEGGELGREEDEEMREGGEKEG